MTASTTTSPTTHTLEVPGALVTYDVRRNDTSDEPVLFLIGSPMGAAGFGTLAELLRRPHGGDLRPARRRAQPAHRRRGHLDARRARGRPAPASSRPSADRSTCSPAAAARSTRSRWSPATRRTSARWSRTNPRSPPWCPTPSTRWPACRDMHETYQRDGIGAGHGQVHRASSATRAPSRPTTSRRPPRTRRCSACRPRTTARGTTCCSGRTCCPARPTSPTSTRSARRRPASSSAVGAESEGELARRAAEAVAERLGTTPEVFPSDHGGFLGGEYGQNGQPEPFAARLREVLGQA